MSHGEHLGRREVSVKAAKDEGVLSVLDYEDAPELMNGDDDGTCPLLHYDIATPRQSAVAPAEESLDVIEQDCAMHELQAKPMGQEALHGYSTVWA